MAVTKGRGWYRLAAVNDSVSDKVHVVGYSFVTDGTADDAFVLKEGSAGSGEIFAEAIADATQHTINAEGMDIFVDGFKATTLSTSCSITVYTSASRGRG